MTFWAIIVFILGVIGLIHEYSLASMGIPFYGEATSVCLMLASLGMFYTAWREKKKKK